MILAWLIGLNPKNPCYTNRGSRNWMPSIFAFVQLRWFSSMETMRYWRGFFAQPTYFRPHNGIYTSDFVRIGGGNLIVNQICGWESLTIPNGPFSSVWASHYCMPGKMRVMSPWRCYKTSFLYVWFLRLKELPCSSCIFASKWVFADVPGGTCRTDTLASPSYTSCSCQEETSKARRMRANRNLI